MHPIFKKVSLNGLILAAVPLCLFLAFVTGYWTLGAGGAAAALLRAGDSTAELEVTLAAESGRGAELRPNPSPPRRGKFTAEMPRARSWSR